MVLYYCIDARAKETAKQRDETGLASDEQGDAGGQRGSEGPFLLEHIAPLSGLDEVDGIPRRQPGNQGWDRRSAVVKVKKARRRVVCGADLATGSDGQEESLPPEEDKRQRPVGVVVSEHGGHDGGQRRGGNMWLW